ncbi:hypothetical protein [Acinetobacter ursingii]|uniref:Heme utilization protein n=3 Tax=Acinetobacter TaxID=469 RepID=A0A3A8E8W1_9GAMM|nr:hypothetical protein [Acinetobacter ursingii]MCU4589636.1 hypothetical protein [Acinetobacter ursingii]RKG31257.1 hypothetical protein D7V21_14370 [Acinetobacter guerrae]
MKIKIIASGMMVALICSLTHATSDEWSKRWASSESRLNSNFTQANLIKLEDSDYYEGLGRTSITSNTYIERQETSTNIGQYTNSVGAMNSSSNSINIDGTNNNTTVSNGADTTGSDVKSGIQLTPQNGNSSQCINLSVREGGTSSCS